MRVHSNVADLDSIAPPADCPRCRSTFIEYVKAMRPYARNEDWFRCDKCGHLFTRPHLTHTANPIRLAR